MWGIVWGSEVGRLRVRIMKGKRGEIRLAVGVVGVCVLRGTRPGRGEALG
jgi:hypothetical protein